MKGLKNQQSQAVEEVEKLLLICINKKQLASDSILEAMICGKVNMLHANLLKGYPQNEYRK